ncbi:MAG TPA: hypothetical protein VD907_05410 [Verrucomicrobiae bacterium]|nr:hypothetical protein [Verrucomicrobiae bacterium]
MELSFGRLIVGVNRQAKEQLCRFMPQSMTPDFIRQCEEIGNKKETILLLGSLNGYIYDVAVLRHNIFLRIVREQGNFTLKEVQAYVQKNKLPSLYVVFKPDRATDETVQKIIDSNFMRGRAWDYNLNLPRR